jgi:hypothetical protein
MREAMCEKQANFAGAKTKATPSTASRIYGDMFWSAAACYRLGSAKLASPNGRGIRICFSPLSECIWLTRDDRRGEDRESSVGRITRSKLRAKGASKLAHSKDSVASTHRIYEHEHQDTKEIRKYWEIS